ncbi:MAG: invasion associated locus B family protein [Proteobacteria bacterium]|nr:invasion associated locus B family protein [Pseudomonadota bacterium]
MKILSKGGVRAVGIAALMGVFMSVFGHVPAAHAQEAPIWQKVCGDEKKAETCRIVQQHFMNKVVDGKTQTIGRVVALTVIYVENQKTKKRSPYLSVDMPLGVDLRPGAVLRVDKGAEIPVAYLQCTQAGCAGSLPLTAPILETFTKGVTIKVGFRPWGTEQVSVVEASLKGFSAAFKGIK